MRSLTIGRREFLRVCGLVSASALAAACAPAEATPAPEKPAEPTVAEAKATAAPVSKYQEAPMLAERVQAGELPPVDERLPIEPKITNEMPPSQLEYEIGRYGGTLRHAALQGRDADIQSVMLTEPLVNTPGLLGEEVTANVLEGFEVSQDLTEFTFYLREGMRWSDGELVTIEDVRYAWEDVMMNETLTSTPPAWLKSGGSPTGEIMTLEIVDDFTFRMKSAEPYGGFLLVLALEGWMGYETFFKPAHYLEKFHAKYASEAELDALIAENEPAEDWIQLHQMMDGAGKSDVRGIGKPRLDPWILVSQTQEQNVHERNPYYWKVDPAGNQLPYIDRIVTTFVQDSEVLNLKFVSGEVDYAREALALNKMPFYKEHEDKGYVAGMYNMHITPTDVFINWAYDDPVWRQVVQDKRFRQALAYAIDREDIVDSVYLGFAQPSTIGISEFNPDKANALLDDMGLDKRDADGFRLGPDGKTFTIDFLVSSGLWADLLPVTELIVEFWNDIGLKTTMKAVDTGLWWNTAFANEVKATVINTQTPIWPMVAKLDWWIYWGPPWVTWWYSGGEQGEEPPDEIKEFLVNLNSIYKVSVGEGPATGQAVLDEIGEKLIYFIPIQHVIQPMIYNAKLGNIGEDPAAFAIAYNFSAEQFFFKE